MRITITTESRFDRLPDGSVWALWGHPYKVWRHRFLDIFDSVQLIARTRDVTSVAETSYRVDGPSVEVTPVPYYVGLSQFLRRERAVRAACRAAIDPTDAVLFPVPSPLAAQADRMLNRRGQPYAVAVIGDPGEAFSSQGIHHPLRPLLRRVLVHQQRRLCAGAAAAGYPSARLRSLYPCPAHLGDLTWAPLPPEAYVASARRPDQLSHRSEGDRRLVSVGTLEVPYKGMDTLIEALAICRQAGAAYELTIVGSGRGRASLEEQVEHLGLSGQVRFAGHLRPGAAVRDELDRADLFVLASRSEARGMALVQAMARGVPSVATSVGGLPDLLAPGDLVNPNNPAELAARLQEVLASPDEQARMSARNLHRARDYSQDALGPRWQAFLDHLRRKTEEAQTR